MKIGHARERSPGTYELRWRPRPGAKIRTETIKAKSQRAADLELAKRVAAAAEGRGSSSASPAKLTCAEWFDQWVSGISLVMAPTTVASYESVVRCQLKPHLGKIRLRDLSPADVKLAFVKMAETRSRSGLRAVRTVLGSALDEAVTLGLLTNTPLEKLRAKRGKKHPLGLEASPKAKPVDKNRIDEEIKKLAIGHPYRMAIYLGIVCGLRLGEICGLCWKDVKSNKIEVRRQIVQIRGKLIVKGCKYDSERDIAIGGKFVELLQQHRRVLAENLLALGVRLTNEMPVCAQPTGAPIKPHAYSTWARTHGIRAHSQRHYNASALLATQPMPVVTQRLGHSTPVTTLRTYAHVIPGQENDAADAIDAVITA
jgi:integrase